MRKWLIPLLLVVLLVISGVAVYFFHFAGRVEMTAHQRGHLQAEAERLAADPAAIDQQDAAWIAQRLSDDPTADELARLGEERLSYLAQQYAEKLESDYPDLWFAWERKAVTDNGNDELEAAGKLAKLVRDDARFKALMDNAATETVSEKLRTEYLAETDPVMDVFRRAADAKSIVRDLPRLDSLLDPIESPEGYHAFRVLSVRVRLLAEAGLGGQAQDKMDLLMEVYSRMDWDLSLIGVLVHGICSGFLLRNAALPLVERYDVPADRARHWLELAAQAQRDVVYAIAVDLIQTAHLNVTDPERTFVRFSAPDFGEDSTITLVPRPVEEVFTSLRRNQAVVMDVCEYLQSEHESRLTPEGQLQAARAFQRSPFLVLSNLKDDVEARFAWAALDLRIAEREHGSLAEIADKVLARWPAIRTEWRDGTLELWCRTEYRFHEEASAALMELKPVQ